MTSFSSAITWHKINNLPQEKVISPITSLQEFTIDNFNFHIIQTPYDIRIALKKDNKLYIVYKNKEAKSPDRLRKLFINAWTTLEIKTQDLSNFLADPFKYGIIHKN